MTKMKNHARLRLVSATGELVEPRRYAQSTSGRRSSHRMSPALSRSSEMTSDSPIKGLVDNAFRRYPIVVLHRDANADCSGTGSELRYARSDSMGNQYLPMGTLLSSNAGNLPLAADGYPWVMRTKAQEKERVHAIRRRKLQMLVDECGSQAELSQRLSGSSYRGLGDASYISRLLSGKPRAQGGKNLSGDIATEIENLMGKPLGWLSRDEGDPPLSVDADVWGQLEPGEQEAIQTTVHAMITGFLSSKKKTSRRAG